MKLHKDWREFIELLNAGGVRYLIVGGIAVGYHGYPRLTVDIDFFVEPSPENAGRIVHALRNFGFGDIGIGEADLQKLDQVVQLGRAPYRIDLMTSIENVSFEEAWNSRVQAALEGIPVQLLGREQLLRNKKSTGRPKDLGDYHELGGRTLSDEPK